MWSNVSSRGEVLAQRRGVGRQACGVDAVGRCTTDREAVRRAAKQSDRTRHVAPLDVGDTHRELGQRFKVAGFDISPEEWAILLLLWREDGQFPGQMAARTVRDPTTMTRLVDTMVRKKLVYRQADEVDRRRSKVCLTQLGQGLQPKLTGLAAPMIETAMAGISQQDVEQVLRVLQQMVENLNAGQQAKDN